MIEISKAVIIRGDKYLLLKRASRSRAYPDKWDFAGGKHEPGETPEQAVVRETKEETALSINPGKELKKEEYHDKKYDLLFHYFIPTFSGEIRLSDDHSEYRWISKEDIKDFDLHPSVRMFFRD